MDGSILAGGFFFSNEGQFRTGLLRRSLLLPFLGGTLLGRFLLRGDFDHGVLRDGGLIRLFRLGAGFADSFVRIPIQHHPDSRGVSQEREPEGFIVTVVNPCIPEEPADKGQQAWEQFWILVPNPLENLQGFQRHLVPSLLYLLLCKEEKGGQEGRSILRGDESVDVEILPEGDGVHDIPESLPPELVQLGRDDSAHVPDYILIETQELRTRHGAVKRRIDHVEEIPGTAVVRIVPVAVIGYQHGPGAPLFERDVVILVMPPEREALDDLVDYRFLGFFLDAEDLEQGIDALDGFVLSRVLRQELPDRVFADGVAE